MTAVPPPPPAVPPRQDALVEAVPCAVCGADDAEVLREARYPAELTQDWLLQVYSSSSDRTLFDQLVRCRRCALVYLSPRVREDIIARSYAEAVDPTFIEQDPDRIRTFRRSLKGLARRHGLWATRTSTRVLDVGCAGGAFVKAATDLGFEPVGVEPSAWLAEQARSRYGIDVRAGTLGDQRFAPGSFELVTLWDVIEHLTRPSEVLEQVKAVLGPRGLLVVNYPDYGSLARQALGERWPFFLSVHLLYFTRQTLSRFLQERGFEVLETRPYFQTLSLGYVLKRASAYFEAIKLAQQAAGATGLGKLPFTYNMGQSLLVARKTA